MPIQRGLGWKRASTSSRTAAGLQPGIDGKAPDSVSSFAAAMTDRPHDAAQGALPGSLDGCGALVKRWRIRIHHQLCAAPKNDRNIERRSSHHGLSKQPAQPTLDLERGVMVGVSSLALYLPNRRPNAMQHVRHAWIAA